MAKCINNIIDTNVASSGALNASTTTPKAFPSGTGIYIDSPVKGNGDVRFSNSYADAVSSSLTQFTNNVNGLTLKLRNTDCTQEVLDFFQKQFPVATTMLKQGYDWTSNNLNMQSGINKLGNSLKGGNLEKLADQFCDTVTNMFRTLIFYLDVATKAAFVIFKKIDALRKKIEKALLEFTSAVRDCLVSVIVDAKNAINRVVRKVLDFDVVLDLMEHCPCITKIIASMFNCKEDKDGNKLTTASQVLNCVIDKFSLDPSKIINAINNFIDNTILDTLNKGFNLLDEFIKNTMELLMTPFRELIRLYSKFLTNKINMTIVIRAIEPADCLLIYTKEYDTSGSSFLGMSIIDMINTLKSWANCFEFACSSFVDDVSNKIKELNENLRLDDRYWRDVLSIDLYQSAIGVKVQSNQPRPAMIREIFTKNQGKGKDVFTGIIDSFKQVGSLTIDVGWNEKQLGDAAQAIKFKDGPDNEGESAKTNNNTQAEPFSSSIEDYLMSIEANLCNDNDPYFVERFYELLAWVSSYKKSGSHIKQIDNLLNSQQQQPAAFLSNSPSTAYQPVGDRVYFKGTASDEIPTVVPTYEVADDYNASIINKIQNYNKPTRNTNENLRDYYSRWFNGAIA